jgi:hypothetical protein
MSIKRGEAELNVKDKDVGKKRCYTHRFVHVAVGSFWQKNIVALTTLL